MSQRVNAARRLTITVAFFLAAVSPALRAADTPKPTGGAQRVVKFVTTMTDFSAGVSTTHLYVTPADGGPVAKLILTDEARRKVSFNDRGELITITVKTGSLGSDIVTAVAPFDGPKSLKSPKAYQFQGLGEQKVGVQTFTTAKLARLGQTREALIPNRPVPGGKPAPDAAMLERLNATKQGDVVEVELAPAPGVKNAFTLVDVDAYREPLIGDFVKLDTIKDGNKSFPGVTLTVDGGEPKTYAFPVPTPGAPPSPQLAAIQTLAKRLKPGYTVRFIAKDDPRNTLREMKVDGQMEPTSDRHYNLLSTYVRISFSASGTSTYVYFYPGSHRPADRQLESGVSRVSNSSSEANRLKLTVGQLQQLRSALDSRIDRQDTAPTQQERTQWANAYTAWAGAQDEATRARVEQEMFWAAQDVSSRWRKDVEAKYTIMRSILTGEQFDEVMKMGKRNTPNSSPE